MPSNSDEDVDDIVIDDRRPREDGLATDEDVDDASSFVGRSEEWETIAAAIPQIFQRLENLARPTTTAHAVEDGVAEALNDMTSRLDRLMDRLASLEDRLDDQTTLLAAATAPRETAARQDVPHDTSVAATQAIFSETPVGSDSQFGSPDGDRGFEQLVFGETLCRDRSLDGDRSQLIDGVHQGHAASIVLAARLMLMHASGVEDLPPLLKEIGEA